MSRTLALFLLLFTLPISACTSQEFKATPFIMSEQFPPGATYQGIRLLGALQFNDAKIDDLPLCGLSGLAWDEDAGVLYALSDQGHIFHLRPAFDQQGYLIDALAIAGYPLRDAAGKPLRYLLRDAEGLAIRQGENQIPGDTELIVSFEARPRVIRYSPTGQWRGKVPLPPVLRNSHNYRDPNEALEAITLEPRWGLVVGSEKPLRNDPPGIVRLFTPDSRFWLYPLAKAPGSALVAMETLPDGSILTLERAFVSVLQPFTISLRRIRLARPAKTALLPVSDVAAFRSDMDWRLDNFEGLAHHRGQRFFAVSDDNCSSFQRTLLLYFALLPTTTEAGKLQKN